MSAITANRKYVSRDEVATASKQMLDVLVANRHNSHVVAQEMRSLGNNFSATGNERIAARLHNWADEIEEMAEIAWNAHGEEQMEELKHSERMLGETVRLALTVVTRQG